VPDGSVPGVADPFDRDLDDVRTRIIMLVATSLIRPGELERVDVGWGPRVPIRDCCPITWSCLDRKSHEDGEEPCVLVAAIGELGQ